MPAELILSRDSYLLTFELRLFWTVAFLYAFSFLLFVSHIIARSNAIGAPARGTHAESWVSVGRAAYALMWATAIFHTLLITFRTFNVGRAPFQTLYETLSWFAFTTSLTYLIVSRKYKDVYLPAAFVTLLSAGACFYALFSRSPAADPLSPPLQSWWFEWHVILAFLSYAVFVVSSSIETSYLIAKPLLKRNSKEAFSLNAENLEDFRRSSYNLALLGFPLLTFAVFSGAGWANEAWGRYWSWDPKETWSLITWTVFAMYLHSVSVPKWRGNVASVLNILGFIAMMMTFLGVNWLAKLLSIPSLHIYAV